MIYATEGNYKESIKWFKQAAERGEAKGQFFIGYAYYQGDGVTPNLMEAIKWLTLSADQGYLEAQEILKKIAAQNDLVKLASKQVDITSPKVQAIKLSEAIESAEKVIQIISDMYWKNKQENPGKDEHIYLASTLMSIYVKMGIFPLETVPQSEHLEKAWFETVYFAILDPPVSIRALCLHFIGMVLPQVKPQYIDEFESIMAPVFKLKQEGTFVEVYRKKNPLTVSQYDSLHKVK